MDEIFAFFQGRTFWRILLFCHFVMAVALLAMATLQAVAVLMPVRQAAGNFIDRVRSVPPAWYAAAIAILYLLNFLLGAWVYIKYRTYVRIPMEQLGHWWTLGSFELKEHVASMGVALLPAYWYFWRQPLSEEHAGARKWLAIFLAFCVWYSFLIGHIANDFRGVGA
jgi:heme A synthase